MIPSVLAFVLLARLPVVSMRYCLSTTLLQCGEHICIYVVYALSSNSLLWRYISVCWTCFVLKTV